MDSGKNLVCKFPIEFLNGEKKEMLACFGTFIVFQELTGKDPWDKKQVEKMSPKDYVALVSAAIYQEKAAEHLSEVQQNINFYHMETIKEFVRRLYDSTMTDQKKDEESSSEPQSQEAPVTKS